MKEHNSMAKYKMNKGIYRVKKNIISFLPELFYESNRKKLVNFPLIPMEFSVADHFPHNPFGIEWWYFTGVVNTPEKKHPLGFEATFFRISTIGKGNIMHLAITDADEGKFHNKCLYAAIYPKWLNNKDSRHVVSLLGNYLLFDESKDRFIINIKTGDLSVYLQLDAGSMMSHGGNGIIDDIYLNGGSYYYSLPNLKTEGLISYGGKAFDVSGMTWHDHQWGNFPICALAWEWFSLRFDMEDLYIMIFRFKGGKRTKHIGTLMFKNKSIGIDEISVRTKETFTTKNGLQYKIGWNLCMEIDSSKIVLDIIPMVKNQCIDSLITPSYWEGLCTVEGEVLSDIELYDTRLKAETKLKGYAYVELTNYE
jgi:predicted secreted hydrolase